MAGTKMGVVGCGGRMGRMLVAEIAATEGCSVAGGSEAPGSGYVNQDIGELAGIGRIGIPIGETVEKVIRDSDVVLEFTSPEATAEHAELAASLGTAMVIGTGALNFTLMRWPSCSGVKTLYILGTDVNSYFSFSRRVHKNSG